MQICVCDDDKTQHITIGKYIEKYAAGQFEAGITDMYSAGELTAHYSSGKSFDIVILAIETAGMNAAEMIRREDPNAILILISDSPKRVFEAFRVEALHFIVKPVSEIEFVNIFDRAVRKYNTLNPAVTLRSQSERYVIPVNSIRYIEGYDRHITVYTTSGAVKTVGKIADILPRLASHGFIRIHQGFIVNMSFIRCFDVNRVVLTDGTGVMMSQRRKAAALKAFDTFLKRKNR